MKVNFTDVQSSNYEAIPQGTYNANVTDGEKRTGKESNAEYIHWEFTVSDGEYEGRKIWTNTTLQENGLFFLKSLLEATGKFDVNGDLDFEIDDVIGSPVKIVVKVKDYEGDQSNVIKRFKAANSATDGEPSLLP